MPGEVDGLRRSSGAQVILDGQAVGVPEDIRGSVTAIRDFLETFAMRRERTLTSLSVDGVAVNLKAKQFEFDEFKQIKAESVSFFDLGKQMISRARQQIEALRGRAESAVTRFLINDGESVSALWREWLPELKSPLLVMGFIKQLCGSRVDELGHDGVTLGAHVKNFSGLWAELEKHADIGDGIQLSDKLEHAYIPWIQSFLSYLKQLESE